MNQHFNSSHNPDDFNSIINSLKISLGNAMTRVLQNASNQTQIDTRPFLFPKVALHCFNCDVWNQSYPVNNETRPYINQLISLSKQTLIEDNLYTQFTTELLQFEKYPGTNSEDICNNYNYNRYGIVGIPAFRNYTTNYVIGIKMYYNMEWQDSATQILNYTTACTTGLRHCTSRVYPIQCASVPENVPCESVPLCEPCKDLQGPLTTTTTLSPIPNFTFSPTHAAKQIAPENKLEVAASVVGGLAVVIVAALVVVTIRLYRNPSSSSYSDDEEKIPLIIP